MAAKKSRGLGRGLDALFGDMEVDILKNDNEALHDRSEMFRKKMMF